MSPTIMTDMSLLPRAALQRPYTTSEAGTGIVELNRERTQTKASVPKIVPLMLLNSQLTDKLQTGTRLDGRTPERLPCLI